MNLSDLEQLILQNNGIVTIAVNNREFYKGKFIVSAENTLSGKFAGPVVSGDDLSECLSNAFSRSQKPKPAMVLDL
jgi:hypothetical protein